MVSPNDTCRCSANHATYGVSGMEHRLCMGCHLVRQEPLCGSWCPHLISVLCVLPTGHDGRCAHSGDSWDKPGSGLVATVTPPVYGDSRTYPPARKEAVDHPAHYGGANNPYEAIKVIEAWGLNFCLANTVKYISRAEKKGSPLEDLKKARWYLDREIQNRQKVENDEAAAALRAQKPTVLP